jgi:putative thioredoxin
MVMAGAHVIEVTEADFEERVIEASRRTPVVVDFWAGWCRPCLVLGPVLERLADEHGGRFTLAKLDVDANPGVAGRYGVQGIPAVKAFRDGQVSSEFVGAQPEEVVRRFLDQVVPSEADEAVARARGTATEEAAEAAYRKALELRPDHPEAMAGLAELLARRGDGEEARALLARVPAAGSGRRLLAELDLRALAGEPSELGRVAAQALDGDPREALDRCLRLISASDGLREEARQMMLRIFDLLGDDHPLTGEFRARLASALF